MSRKAHSPRILFDEQLVLDKLSKLKDPLEKLAQIIDFEFFRDSLDRKLGRDISKRNKGGRPPYDCVLMFKILILQRYYGLSDDNMEFQILDRFSFKRFLCVDLACDIPDSKTIWLFKEQLGKSDGGIKDLFDLFVGKLEILGFVANEGKMVDASFVEDPRQRNSREENKQIKQGEVPEEWKKEENKHKLAQKDTEARWTKKNNQVYYGYKDHVKSDTKSKLVTGYTVTTANVHDSQTLEGLLDERDHNQPLFADSAYTGEEQEKVIKLKEMRYEVCEKGKRNTPLTKEKVTSNREKSKTRARVEHIFGFIENSMGGSYVINPAVIDLYLGSIIDAFMVKIFDYPCRTSL
ncbi:MAG: IS5 family transposase [Cyclobacteriaceae bacterium]